MKFLSEYRGVFVHEVIYGGAHDWNIIAQTCAQYGINALFVSDSGGGGARPDSEIIAAIAACHANGLEYHSAMMVLGETGGPDEILARKSDGSIYSVYWICPIRARSVIKATLEHLVRLGIDGFMFDYIRYDTTETCYCPQCRAAFEQWLGEGSITNWTPFYPDQARWLEYAEWRTIPITELVRDMRSWGLAINPNLKFSEAAWTYFSDCPIYWRKYLGQDTGAWIKEGYLDFVAPMMYTSVIYGTSGETLESEINANLKYMTGGVEGKIPLVPLLASSSLTPEQLKAEIDYVRSRGLGGWILWRYGGPGSQLTPDIRDFLSVLDMPETFAVNNINMTKTNGSITTSWTTDKPATSKVEYNISPLFNAVWSAWGDFQYWWIQHVQSSVLEDTTLKTVHSIAIPTAPEIYFRVQSQNILGKATSIVYYTGELPPLPPENVTPYTTELEEGSYRITMPPQVQVGSDLYNFKQWEDGLTNPVRTINLTADTAITATYELVEAPPTPPLPIAPIVEATAGLILIGVAVS